MKTDAQILKALSLYCSRCRALEGRVCRHTNVKRGFIIHDKRFVDAGLMEFERPRTRDWGHWPAAVADRLGIALPAVVERPSGCQTPNSQDRDLKTLVAKEILDAVEYGVGNIVDVPGVLSADVISRYSGGRRMRIRVRADHGGSRGQKYHIYDVAATETSK